MVIFTLRNIPSPGEIEPVSQPEVEYYATLPDKYNAETWPSFTSLQCFNCTLTSKRIPIFIPTGRSKGKLIRGNGPVYCSIGCLWRSLIDMKLTDSEFKRRSDLTRELISIMFGIKLGIVIPVGDRSSLKRYGGTKSDSDFQKEIIYFCDFIQKCYKNPQDYVADSK